MTHPVSYFYWPSRHINGFPCLEDRASGEHGGLSRSFVCHSCPSLYGHVHPTLLHWCLDVSCFDPFKALTFFSQNSIQISSQIRDAVPSYLQHLGIHQMNLPVNLLYLPLILGEATSGPLRSSVQDRDLLEWVQWKKTNKFKGLEHLSYPKVFCGSVNQSSSLCYRTHKRTDTELN